MANLMRLQVGQRLRLLQDIAPYPLGAFRAGLTGTVVAVNDEALVGAPIAFLKLDEPHEALADDDNELQIFREEDETSEVIPSAFEIVG